MTYRKIPNLFKFNSKCNEILAINEPFKSLKDLTFIGTEKVDGTNVRIIWDGYNVDIKGRTDNSQFQGELENYLRNKFCNKEFENLLEQIFEAKKVVLYGEGFGPKIQNNGHLYGEAERFILFDVDVDNFHLSRTNVIDIANKLGIDFVPEVFTGTLDEAIKFVSNHPASTINSKHEMEGLVLELPLDLYDKNGQRIKVKCRYQDMLKGGLIK